MNQSRRPCIIWGATGQARVAYDILFQEGVEILHVFDNNLSIKSPFPEIPISHGSEGLSSFVNSLKCQHKDPSDIDCIAAIGGVHGEARENMTRLMECHGFNPRPLIHKSAVISPFAVIGKNVQILAGAIIGSFANLGDFVIINSGVNVDHDCKIGKRSHLAPMAALAGEVNVGDDVFIGTNVTILPRIRIENKALIGAGAVVTKDVKKSAILVGNPARPVNKR